MNEKETTIKSATKQAIDPKDFGLDVHAIKKASAISFSTAVRTLMRNWRQGTVSSQGRSDVSRTNRKPYKQKGTGRARAGDSKSPLWKGGGVIFGPQARVRTTKIPKKLKQKIMATLFADYCENNNIVCVDWTMDGDQAKTAQAQNLLHELGLADKKVTIFVAPHDFQVALSFVNIPNAHPLFFDQANVYDLSNSDCWLFLKKDFDSFKGMVSQWL